MWIVRVYRDKARTIRVASLGRTCATRWHAEQWARALELNGMFTTVKTH